MEGFGRQNIDSECHPNEHICWLFNIVWHQWAAEAQVKGLLDALIAKALKSRPFKRWRVGSHANSRSHSLALPSSGFGVAVGLTDQNDSGMPYLQEFVALMLELISADVLCAHVVATATTNSVSSRRS